MSSKSDKKTDGPSKSASSKHKQAEGKERIPGANPEKGSNKTGDEVLNVGNVVMPGREVLDLNDHSVGLKSTPELTGAPSSSKSSNFRKMRFTGPPWSIN